LQSLTLSIALASFNRERLLAQQLDSIVAQGRLPDELIIGDDCSSDGSVGIIKDFADHAPFPVRWYANKHNRGVSRNLEHAIQLCSGDVIVVCDDDDVSLPNRLQVTYDEFMRCPTTGIVVCNSRLVDDELNSLGVTLWERVGLPMRQARVVLKDPISTLARYFFAAGHVLAFRASLVSHILPFPQQFPPGTFFDVWIAIVLGSIADVTCLGEPLVLHRLHSGQIAGVQRILSLRERIGRIRTREPKNTEPFVSLVKEAISRVSTLAESPSQKKNLRRLARWVQHMRMYTQLPARRRSRVVPIAHALITGQYHRYSRGFLTAVRDLLAPPRSRRAKLCSI
jgi:glycosyltransferase involved in cell wall biosynthesis